MSLDDAVFMIRSLTLTHGEHRRKHRFPGRWPGDSARQRLPGRVAPAGV